MIHMLLSRRTGVEAKAKDHLGITSQVNSIINRLNTYKFNNTTVTSVNIYYIIEYNIFLLFLGFFFYFGRFLILNTLEFVSY